MNYTVFILKKKFRLHWIFIAKSYDIDCAISSSYFYIICSIIFNISNGITYTPVPKRACAVYVAWVWKHTSIWARDYRLGCAFKMCLEHRTAHCATIFFLIETHGSILLMLSTGHEETLKLIVCASAKWRLFNWYLNAICFIYFSPFSLFYFLYSKRSYSFVHPMVCYSFVSTGMITVRKKNSVRKRGLSFLHIWKENNGIFQLYGISEFYPQNVVQFHTIYGIHWF